MAVNKPMSSNLNRYGLDVLGDNKISSFQVGYSLGSSGEINATTGGHSGKNQGMTPCRSDNGIDILCNFFGNENIVSHHPLGNQNIFNRQQRWNFLYFFT